MENVLKNIVDKELQRAVSDVLRDYKTGPVTSSFIEKENGALVFCVQMQTLEEKPFEI